MSAAFKFRDYLCWGTNGTIESYLECFCRLAAGTPGTDAALRGWVENERDGFDSGAILYLDDILADPTIASQFLDLFRQATAEFLRGDEFTEIGKEWLRNEPPKFDSHILKWIN